MREFNVGDRVRKVSGNMFGKYTEDYCEVVTLDRPHEGCEDGWWFKETDTWLEEHKLYLVEPAIKLEDTGVI